MKKLMFAAAAIAAGSVFAAGEITSANIVGYSTKASAAESYGYTIMTPTFATVGAADTFKLSTLKFANEPTFFDSIQTFGTDGELGDVLYYMNEGVDVPGWYINGETYVADYEFPRGMSFWLSLAEGALDLTQSGEVNQKAYVVTVPGEYNYAQIGNPFPVDRTIADVAFTTSPTFFDSIQMFGEDGELGDVLYYMDEGVETPGWYLNGETLANDYLLPAGKGFWTSFALETELTIKGLE